MIFKDNILIEMIIVIFLPFLSSLIPIIFDKFTKIRNFLIILLSIITLFYLLDIAIEYQNSSEIYFSLLSITETLCLKFKIESLGLVFSITSCFLWIMTSIYSNGYFSSKNTQIASQKYFYIFMNLSIFSCFAISFAANLFTMFIFYELLTLFSCPLIGCSLNPSSRKATKTYLSILISASLIFLLPAVIMIYTITGVGDFETNGILVGKISSIGIMILLIAIIIGSAKIGLIPLHIWLPRAMVAPVPTSALLHAVAVVNSGMFFILKSVTHIFGINNLSTIALKEVIVSNFIIFISCFTIIVASFIALKQKKLKQMLAYSTITHLAYCLLVVGILTDNGIIAAIIHITAHSLTKITLFFIAGCIFFATKKDLIEDFAGIGKQMPFVALAFTIASFSIIGIPPFAMFASKYEIISAAIDSQFLIIILSSIIISTIFSALYYFKVIYYFYFVKNEDLLLIKKVPFSMNLPIAITTCLIVMFVFFVKDIVDFITVIF